MALPPPSASEGEAMESVELASLLQNKLDWPPFLVDLMLKFLVPSFAVRGCFFVGCGADQGHEAAMELIWWTDWGVARFHLGEGRNCSSVSCLAGHGGRGKGALVGSGGSVFLLQLAVVARG